MDNKRHNTAKLNAKRTAYEAKLSAFYDKKVIELKTQKNGKQ